MDEYKKAQQICHKKEVDIEIKLDAANKSGA